MEKFSYLKSANVDYIEELLVQYAQNPDSVEPTWRYFFEGLELGAESPELANGHAAPEAAPAAIPAGMDLLAEAKVAELIQAYREFGKYMADVNPLSPASSSLPQLELSRFGLTQADLSKTFAAGKFVGLGQAKLSDIIALLKETYCGKIGVEFNHIQNLEARGWIQSRMESSRNRSSLDAATRKLIYKRLSEAEGFERFLHTRYVAQKRFSVEGGESVIPALDCMIETGASLGATEFVMGMAHRGRLNVLTHIFGKKPEMIFTEFEGKYKTELLVGEGDVKYHMGHSADITTRQGKQVHLSLGFNPSHLEFINPVVEGMTRAKQAMIGDKDHSKVIPVLIHGDAAFAGQGVCYETLNLIGLEGYGTGGTLHVVINNQVGFTTSPKDSRSTPYSTDVAKMMDAPIFHVNGDDPEAVWYVSQLCTEYRQKFKADAFIDLVCYRKHGHNEGDEPSFTQPLMYKFIKNHPSTREIYSQKLAGAGVLSAEEAQAIVEGITAALTDAQTKARAENPTPSVSSLEGRWKEFKRPNDEDIFKPVATGVDEKVIKGLAEKINHMPAGFHLHAKLNRFFEGRLKAVQDGKGIDWGNGETLAYATLLSEGYSIRISGQDAERGTFTHRHAVVNDFETGEKYCPLSHIASDKARFNVHNSHLSEVGVLGFEYGYSVADPRTLTIWEAQFGDFANGAQVIIDQFIATAESKWQRMSGLTMLLPHGFEGQGPEHSSARLERFLQLAGKDNIIVCNFTTPAQVFHALRRQMKRDFRKPMVVMSPKSLLRHPMAVSELKDFVTGTTFQEALDDPEMMDAKSREKVKKVILCTGKVFYDLWAERTARKITDVAILRVEQLYPWPAWKVASILANYKNAKDIVWCQEEPRNMGAWSYVFNTWNGGYSTFADQVGGRMIRYAGRPIASSPAVGSAKVHEKEQKALIDQALS